jgi:class 3 adenylate cyclase/tetratricopeptide (TPR) repeat protein
MRCSKCGTDNRETAKFCDGCGAQLQAQCTSCGTMSRAGARFCDSCGKALSASLPQPAPSATEESISFRANIESVASALGEAAPAAPADTASLAALTGGERRHLTVLFCDLVGSTAIAAHLDPEDWRETLASYHGAATEAIVRFGGHVAKYLGDGVMAYFGCPTAHDNDAERAARAGLAVLDAISKLNGHPARPKLSARVGIDSGLVVVGAGAGSEADIFGDTPNIASRVQAAAEPGAVLITGATHLLVSGLFVVEASGAQQLKGLATPVELYRVIRPTGVRGRLGAARGLTPFVGREEELRLLLSRWERAREGEGQVAMVMGEAGIGKSRLVAEFHERIRGTPHIWMESAGEQFFENTPFHAIIEMLSQWLELQGGVNADERLERLEQALASARLKPNEAVPLIADLLQLPVGGRYPVLTLTSEQKRRRLLATLAGWVFGAARLQPLVMVVEDLHWLDPSTLELQQVLAEQGATAPLLLLHTARPEFHAQWPQRAHHTQITLNRLSVGNVRMMVAQVAAQTALSQETIAAVLERTGGVPLFVEELTRAILESGIAKLSGREIPVTLHDLLMARLDRLGPAKEVAQLAAVIGADFSYELVQAVSSMAEDGLQASLAQLADAELIYVRGIVPDATYQFKHALIRDAAYGALLKSRRKELHRLVAHTITEKFPLLAETQPEVLARHWTEAGETEQALEQWALAGKAAEARNAFIEAKQSYQQAVALLSLLPESPERDVRELELTISIVRMLTFTSGFSTSETIDATERAAGLAEKTSSLKELVDSMLSQIMSNTAAGNIRAAAALGDRALELALREGSAVLIGRAYSLQIFTRLFLGDFAGVEKHFTAGLRFFDDPELALLPGSASTAFASASWAAWTLGRAEVAREREARLMAVAKNPYNIALSGCFLAVLHNRFGEYEQAEVLAAQALELSQQHQFPFWAGQALCGLGLARSQLGRVAEGIGLIRDGIAGLLKIGTRVSISRVTANLAEVLEREGAIPDALEAVEQALQINPEDLECRPETLRLRGELRLKQGQTELAEADFHDSLALAHSMGAKAWELRTTMSLARLLDEQGRRDQARTMLTEIYNWFTEGFDTADLKDAKALLEQLQN